MTAAEDDEVGAGLGGLIEADQGGEDAEALGLFAGPDAEVGPFRRMVQRPSGKRASSTRPWAATWPTIMVRAGLWVGFTIRIGYAGSRSRARGAAASGYAELRAGIYPVFSSCAASGRLPAAVIVHGDGCGRWRVDDRRDLGAGASARSGALGGVGR